MTGRKVVIIGGVAGGATAAARLRRLDESAEIIILERTGFVSYANCGLPYYIGGIIQDKNALTLQTPASFRDRFRIEVRVNHEAIAIDPPAKTVTVRCLEDGEAYTESYDQLILAPGAKPIKPDSIDRKSTRLMTLRTVEDTYRIHDFIAKNDPKKALVVGGGFIGLEVAENLIEKGIDTVLVQGNDQVLLPLDYDMACHVHAHIAEKGVRLHLGYRVEAFEETETGVEVSAPHKGRIAADFAVIGIGVVPDTHLAKEAGLELGPKGSIVVDAAMRTSEPDIYAVGDAVEVRHFVTGEKTLIALAGPANKQGRIAADNICGIANTFSGSQGSSIIKVFDMTIANTGINEKIARSHNIPYDKVVTTSSSHAGYYPGSTEMIIKTLFDPSTGNLLGAQIVGHESVDKRIDVLATAIRAGLSASDLETLDLAYAPPYSSAKDPVNMVGFSIENIRTGLIKQFHWEEVEALIGNDAVTILDVRSAAERRKDGFIDTSVAIPVNDIRDRMDELDKAKPVYIYCRTGLRSYIACRILTQNGFDCYNLSGGYNFYSKIDR